MILRDWLGIVSGWEGGLGAGAGELWGGASVVGLEFEWSVDAVCLRLCVCACVCRGS